MGAVKLLLALLLVTVNLISNSAQLTTREYVTSGYKDDVGKNPEESEITSFADLPEKYRDTISRFGGTNYKHSTNSKGGGKTVKITIRRRVKIPNKNNNKSEKQSTIYKAANDYTPQEKNNIERRSSSSDQPKYMSYKNYITSVNSKKRVHKIVPYDDVARARFKSIYYGKKRPSESMHKGSKYNLRYEYNNVKKTPEISDSYADVVSYPEDKDSGTSSIIYNRPANERGDSKSWHEIPSVKHSVKVTKHVIRTKTRIPIHRFKESGIGDNYYIDDSSENPIEGIPRQNDYSDGPPNFEKAPLSPDIIETSGEVGKTKDIPTNNVDYTVVDESNVPDLSSKDQISGQNVSELPPSIINLPKDQDVILSDDFPTKDIVLEEKPKEITVKDTNSASDNPEYVIINVPSKKDKSTDVIPKESSNEYLVNTEAPKFINVTPQNIEGSDGTTNILYPPNKRPNSKDISDESNSEDDDHAFEEIFKPDKNENPNKEKKYIYLDPKDVNKSVGTKHKKIHKMIVYKKTSERNIHKHNIKFINYLRNKKQETTKIPEYLSPLEIIPDIEESPSLPDESEEKPQVVEIDNENDKEIVLLPDAIKVQPLNPYMVKELVRNICGTAQQLLNRIPDSFLVDKLKQIFKQLTFINNNLKDYIGEDREFHSVNEYPNDTPIIDKLKGSKDKPIIAVQMPDYGQWDNQNLNKKRPMEFKDSLPYISQWLQLLKDYDPKKQNIGYKYPDDSDDYYVPDKLDIAPSGEIYDDNYLSLEKNQKDRIHYGGGPIYDNNDLLDGFVDIIKDYTNDPRPNVNFDQYIKTNIGRILPHMLQNRPTLMKLRKLVAFLSQNLAKENTTPHKNCEAKTYKKLLKNAYDFLSTILKLPIPL